MDYCLMMELKKKATAARTRNLRKYFKMPAMRSRRNLKKGTAPAMQMHGRKLKRSQPMRHLTLKWALPMVKLYDGASVVKGTVE